MDNLDKIFAKQYELQRLMEFPMGEGQKGTKESILAIIVECTEVLDEINWKPWRKTRKTVDHDKLRTEITDILQFWVNCCFACGITPKDVMESLEAKWKINYERVDKGY